jgi:hypothetical protein
MCEARSTIVGHQSQELQMRLAVIAMTTLLVGACHYRATPVPMSGDPASIKALAGTWTGTYRGTESGRSGTITFTIRVDGDSAFGDVLMEAPGVTAFQPADDPVLHRAHVSNPRLLGVRFVDIQAGQVEGALEPYLAPDCDCTVQTRFRGRVIADTVRGTFVTRGTMLTPQTGVWAVTRQH